MLAAATMYVKSVGGNQGAVVYTSVGIAFIQFIGLVIFHAYVAIVGLRQRNKERRQRMENPPDNHNEYEPIVAERPEWPPVVSSQLQESAS